MGEALPGQGGTPMATGTPRPSPAPTRHPTHPHRQSRGEHHPPRPQRRKNRLQPRGAQRVKQEANRRCETSWPPALRRRAEEPRKYAYARAEDGRSTTSTRRISKPSKAPTRGRRPSLRARRAREAAASTQRRARAPNQGGPGLDQLLLESRQELVPRPTRLHQRRTTKICAGPLPTLARSRGKMPRTQA